MAHPKSQPIRTHAHARMAADLAIHLLLLTAVPLALWKLTGNPIPHHLPTWDAVQAYWRGTEQEPSQIIYPFIQLVADVAWILWAWYALWFALALLWILLRLPAATVPNALAAITPAIALRAISLATVTATGTTPASHAPVTTASSTITTPRTVAPTAVPARSAPRTDIVKPDDNLWDIAKDYYHQPTDWTQIYTANRGVRQPDGQALTDPDLIQPGWRLTIPALTGPAANATAPDRDTGDAPPANGATGATRGPATARPAPNRTPGPAAPTRPQPAAGRPTPAARPAPDRPHTVGYHLPDAAGYTGITLITAIGAAVAVLRTRNRHRGRERDDSIPELALRLAATHSAADSADAYGYRPDEHPGEQPPPIYRLQPDHPVLGTTPNQQHETALDPDQIPGPIAYTGPGALAAARATAISTLATPGHTLHTDPELAAELLGPSAHHEPGWLETDQPSTSTDHHRDPHAIVIHSTKTPASEDAEREPEQTFLIGDPTDEEHTTVLSIDTDGALNTTSGPASNNLAGTRLHTYTKQAATDLYQTLYAARPAPQTEPDHEHTVPEPLPDPGESAPETTADPRALTDAPLVLRVYGDLDILGPANAEPTPVATGQAVALLTLLALNPEGIRAHALRTLEWQDNLDDHRAHIALTTAINRIRAPFRTALGQPADPVLFDKTRRTYRLNPTLVTTDLTLAHNLTEQAKTAEPDESLVLLTEAAALHRGVLAARLDDNHRDWLTTARYNALREAAALHRRAAELAARTGAPETAAHHVKLAVELAADDHETVVDALGVCQLASNPRLASYVYERHLDALRAIQEAPDPAIVQLVQAVREHDRR